MTVKFTRQSPERTLRDKYMDNRNPGDFLREKRAGRLMETREEQAKSARAPDRSRLHGRLEVKDVDTSASDFDKGDVIAPARASVLSGVIAATVSTNRVMPMAINPSTWDVLACHDAIIDESFSRFRLPAIGIRLGYYASGLLEADFEEDDFELDPPKQNLMNVRYGKSYALRAIARCNQQGLTALLDGSDSELDIVSIAWAGPWRSEEQHFMSAEIDDHIIDGTRYSHAPTTANLTVTVPPVDVVEDGDHAVVDITFYTIDGEKWQALMTRIR